MGLQGPFPTAVNIEDEEEGLALLAAVARQMRCYVDGSDHHKMLDKLYARILMACGDD